MQAAPACDWVAAGPADCVEFIKALKVQTPGLLILVYSGFEESIFAMRALRAGASGYLMKRAPRDEMLAAISDILRGELYVSRELAMHVFKEALATQPGFRLPGRAARIENCPTARCTCSTCSGRDLAQKRSRMR